MAARLGQQLKGLQVPPEIVTQIVETLQRNRMDAAYMDKLDGKIPEDFWNRKMEDWRGKNSK